MVGLFLLLHCGRGKLMDCDSSVFIEIYFLTILGTNFVSSASKGIYLCSLEADMLFVG
jgi:hypothetical protein